jgi:hypothetical protein
MQSGWAEHLKVALVGAVGFSITGSTLDEWMRLGIAFATLIYMGFKAATAARDFFKNKHNNNDEKVD